jgi:hypothetical protein
MVNHPAVKYWEILAANLRRSGWSCGCTCYVLHGRVIFVVEAHRDGSRFIIHSDDILMAFLELETQCKAVVLN